SNVDLNENDIRISLSTSDDLHSYIKSTFKVKSLIHRIVKNSLDDIKNITNNIPNTLLESEKSQLYILKLLNYYGGIDALSNLIFSNKNVNYWVPYDRMIVSGDNIPDPYIKIIPNYQTYTFILNKILLGC